MSPGIKNDAELASEAPSNAAQNPDAGFDYSHSAYPTFKTPLEERAYIKACLRQPPRCALLNVSPIGATGSGLPRLCPYEPVRASLRSVFLRPGMPRLIRDVW
jgi:hypothetical protein